MDMLKALEFVMGKDLRVRVDLDGRELVEVRGRDKNIDLHIKDAEAAALLLRELRKWKS